MLQSPANSDTGQLIDREAAAQRPNVRAFLFGKMGKFLLQ
jgi:hypothetical protein